MQLRAPSPGTTSAGTAWTSPTTSPAIACWKRRLSAKPKPGDPAAPAASPVRGAYPGLLVLGTSHVGKSTIAARIGDAIGWPVTSTDSLARHPGRPWTGVPHAVIDFYRQLDDDAIHWFLKVHHANMRPVIGAHVRSAIADGNGFVLEGSALRPESLECWELGEALAVCLTASDDVLRERIKAESAYADRNTEMRLCIDKFIERSIRDGAALVDAAPRYDVPVYDIPDRTAAHRVAQDLIATLTGEPRRG